MSDNVQLIVGLGNPGQQYEKTRHNAGAWLVEQLAEQHNVNLKADGKFFGLVGRIQTDAGECRLLIPTTYMNESGRAIAATAKFYKIGVKNILVAHDELDLPPGTVKLKQGGGHAGHNGLRDTIAKLGNNKDFLRLRIGIGHPGHKDLVLNYVLKRPNNQDEDKIHGAIYEALRSVPSLLRGDIQQGMKALHS